MVRSRPWLRVAVADAVESTLGNSDDEFDDESSSDSSTPEANIKGKGKATNQIGRTSPSGVHKHKHKPTHTHASPALALLAGLYERYQEQRLAVYLKLPADVQDGLPVEEFQRGSLVGKWWCALMKRGAEIFGR